MDSKTITGVGVGALLLGGAALVSAKRDPGLGSTPWEPFDQLLKSDSMRKLRFKRCKIMATDALDQGYVFPLSRLGWRLALNQTLMNRGTFMTLVCDGSPKGSGIPLMENTDGVLTVTGTGRPSKWMFEDPRETEPLA